MDCEGTVHGYEPVILDYLAEHYAPEERAGCRQPLTGIEWYELGD